MKIRLIGPIIATVVLLILEVTASAADGIPAVNPNELNLDSGQLLAEISYLGQTRQLLSGANQAVKFVVPAAAAYFDRDRSMSKNQLCFDLELTSAQYRADVSAKAAGSEVALIPSKDIVVYLSPRDPSEPPYSQVQPRRLDGGNALQAKLPLCFYVGAERDIEALARESSVRTYYTTTNQTGVATDCSVNVSLLDYANQAQNTANTSVSGAGQSVYITGSQITDLLSTKKAMVTIQCQGSNSADIAKIRDQIGAAIPKLLERMDGTEIAWNTLKGQMWSLGFSTNADTVIDKLQKHSNTTVSTKDLEVKAADLKGLGITGKAGETITDENMNSEGIKVTIPASVRVYRFSKSDLASSTTMSSRELVVSGKTAATLSLVSNFVEDGVLRVVSQIQLPTFPANAVVAWYGGPTSQVPSTWARCDGGTYATSAGALVVTPNLNGRFLFGDYLATGVTGGAGFAKTGINVTKSGWVAPAERTRCIRPGGDGGDCMATGPNPTLVSDVVAPENIGLMPPYAAITWICKLP